MGSFALKVVLIMATMYLHRWFIHVTKCDASFRGVFPRAPPPFPGEHLLLQDISTKRTPIMTPARPYLDDTPGQAGVVFSIDGLWDGPPAVIRRGLAGPKREFD